MSDELYMTGIASDQVIWRYIDFPKLLSLLQNKALFFTQVPSLSDSYEGSYRLFDHRIEPQGQFREMLEAFYKARQGMRARTATNCWHMNSGESTAMWKLYAGQGYGIAIQSTVEYLRASMQVPQASKIRFGKVIYGPPEIKPGPKGFPGHLLFFHKRPSFEHEREFRAVLEFSNSKQLSQHSGAYVSVDLSVLIKAIYIAPDSPRWYAGLLSSVVNETYTLPVSVIQSDLDAPTLI